MLGSRMEFVSPLASSLIRFALVDKTEQKAKQ